MSFKLSWSMKYPWNRNLEMAFRMEKNVFCRLQNIRARSSIHLLKTQRVRAQLIHFRYYLSAGNGYSQESQSDTTVSGTKCFLGHLQLTANLCFLSRTTLCWKPGISIKLKKIISRLFENKDRERWGLVAEENCTYQTDQGLKFCLLNRFLPTPGMS